jgi:hypothetical protein
MDRREVENWFEHGALSRVMERRTHGVTPDWLMSELVRRPGEVNRNAATSLTTRTDQPTDEDPGAGEWHGSTHHMVPAAPKFDPAYVRHWVDEAERYRYFQQALAEEEVDPAFIALTGRAAVDSAVGFRDRRFQGRRHRPTNDDNQWHSRPYPEPEPVDPDRQF